MESDLNEATPDLLDARGAEPGRRLTTKGEATRARIVEAAAQLIADNGVGGTSNEAVRRAAGVSGSQMTNCFADKGALVRAVIARQQGSVLDFMRQPELGRIETLEGLRTWAELVVEHQRQLTAPTGCRFGSLAGELGDADEQTRTELAAGFDRWQAELASCLQTIIDGGELSSRANAAELATCLLASLQGGMLLARTTASVEPLECALAGAVAHIEAHGPADATASGARA